MEPDKNEDGNYKIVQGRIKSNSTGHCKKEQNLAGRLADFAPFCSFIYVRFALQNRLSVEIIFTPISLVV